MGDGKYTCDIHGIGTIEIYFDNKHKIRLHNVICVPYFEVPLFRINIYLQYDGCYQHAEGQVFTV